MGGISLRRRRKPKGLNLVMYIIIVLGMILSLIAPRIAPLIEAGYSRSMYKLLIRPYSLLTGFFPFSLAEFAVLGLALFGLVKLVQLVRGLRKSPGETIKKMPGALGVLALALALTYVAFNMLWGLNYSRLSFARIADLPVQPGTVAELKELALALTENANTLRQQVAEDSRGVMVLPQGAWDALARADKGYEKAAKIYPELGGKYGRPKGVFLSRYWSYTGVTGMYFPFTAEANVNIDIPHFMLPATAAHEMAHQRGFAREDEANFLAYLTCSVHPDADFRYSGTVLALLNTMNALYRADPDAYKEVRVLYGPGLNRDLQDWSEYWQRYEGPVEKASNKINDSYLKANRQQDGVRSYGRMVDLLLAMYRQGKIK
jgi:hypothetical protein